MLTKIIKKVVEKDIVTNQQLAKEVLSLHSEIGTLRFEVYEQVKLRKDEVISELREQVRVLSEKVDILTQIIGRADAIGRIDN